MKKKSADEKFPRVHTVNSHLYSEHSGLYIKIPLLPLGNHPDFEERCLNIDSEFISCHN